MDTKPLVVIRCITYNHEPFIRDALEGFVMQKTSFPFVAVVHDDASTDGTASIIREYAEKYPNIIKPIYETENQYSKRDGSLRRIMNEACDATGAKYIAFCEGDDYWIDPLKLQKQVDFLEANPEYGMCYTNFNIKNEKSNIIIENIFTSYSSFLKPEYDSVEDFIISTGYVCPPSWVYRANIKPDNSINCCDGTFVYFTKFLATTKVKYLPETTCVYRLLNESASHSTNYNKIYKRNKNILETQLNLIEMYACPTKVRQQCIDNYYKISLPQFIYHNYKEDIQLAWDNISKKSLRDLLLFSIYHLRLRKMVPIIKLLLKYRRKNPMRI